MKYQLPCTCGRTIPVEISQAGQTVRCSCGANVDVPAMRLIRSLPPAEPVSSVNPSRETDWPLIASLVFAVGMLMFVGGLGVAGYYQWDRNRLYTDEFKWDNLEESHARIDGFTIEEAWDVWKILRKEPIGPYKPPAFVVHRLFSGFWLRYVLGSLVVAAVGLVLIAAAFISRSATNPTRRPPRRGPTTPVNRPSAR